MRALYFRFFIQTFLFANVCLSCQLPATVNYTYFTSTNTFGIIQNSTVVRKLENYKEILIENQQIPILCPDIFEVIAKTSFVNFREILQESSTRVQFLRCNITTIEPGQYVVKGVLGNLKISWNKLEKLRAGIFNNMPVHQLDLSYNDVRTVESKAFEGNVHLEYLILKGNSLHNVDSLWFKNIVNLKSINLAENYLVGLKKGCFRELIGSDKISINLGYNQIASVEEGVFSEMGCIDSLLLQSNNLTLLPSDLFTNVSFFILHLGNNHLSDLPESYYSCNRKCSNLYLNNNKFTCDSLNFIEHFANNGNGCKISKATKIFSFKRKKC